MRRNVLRLSLHDIHRRYKAGESVKALADKAGCTRFRVNRILDDAGIVRRGSAAANRLMVSKRSSAENTRNTKAAHNAVRGRRQSEQHRCKIAATREQRQLGVSGSERELVSLLSAQGLSVTCQKAVGRYNVDVAIDAARIAVEVFGGHWHTCRRHSERFRKRCDYLLDRGWLPVILWVTGDYPLGSGAVNYLVALTQAGSGDEAGRRQEHVLRGDGKPTGVGKCKLDYRAAVGGDKTGEHTRGADGRFANKAIRM